MNERFIATLSARIPKIGIRSFWTGGCFIITISDGGSGGGFEMFLSLPPYPQRTERPRPFPTVLRWRRVHGREGNHHGSSRKGFP